MAQPAAQLLQAAVVLAAQQVDPQHEGQGLRGHVRERRQRVRQLGTVQLRCKLLPRRACRPGAGRMQAGQTAPPQPRPGRPLTTSSTAPRGTMLPERLSMDTHRARMKTTPWPLLCDEGRGPGRER